jgi:hypothetical protein
MESLPNQTMPVTHHSRCGDRAGGGGCSALPLPHSGGVAAARGAQEGHRDRRKFEIRSVMRILRGQLAEPSPEARLWLAVIEFAVRDAYSSAAKSSEAREDARRWLQSDHFAGVATAIGLHPEWARQKILQIPDPVAEDREAAETPS